MFNSSTKRKLKELEQQNALLKAKIHELEHPSTKVKNIYDIKPVAINEKAIKKGHQYIYKQEQYHPLVLKEYEDNKYQIVYTCPYSVIANMTYVIELDRTDINNLYDILYTSLHKGD